VRATRGFSLIELLVVLVLAGIIVSMLTLSGGGGAQRAFHFEAERVAQLLALAREEAQVRGAPIRFDADGERYRFLIRRNREWRQIDDIDLRLREWGEPTKVFIERADGTQLVEFGRDAVDLPFAIRLQREELGLRILANGLGSFVVETGP
jgi:general secretion pathway protein H